MKAFDTIWEQLHQDMEWGSYPSEEVVRFVARNFYEQERKNTKILDLGCGAGANTFFLANEGFNAYAIDGSETAVRKAETYLAQNHLQAHTITGDIISLPYDPNFFDCIIDNAVIYAHRLSAIQQILKECHRVLKPGGLLFSTGLFTLQTTGAATGTKLEENTYCDEKEGIIQKRGTAHYFTEHELKETFEYAGFCIEAVDSCVRTEYNQAVVIAYHMITAKKPITNNSFHEGD